MAPTCHIITIGRSRVGAPFETAQKSITERSGENSKSALNWSQTSRNNFKWNLLNVQNSLHGTTDDARTVSKQPNHKYYMHFILSYISSTRMHNLTLNVWFPLCTRIRRGRARCAELQCLHGCRFTAVHQCAV